MAKVDANGIQIEYETFGDPGSPPLLLIIGLGGQLIFWDDDLCRQLAQRGHYVIRFDNRDIGLSSKLEEADVPDLATQAYDRAFYPQGVARQLVAILTQENRKLALASLSTPTLVIHGADDPLVPVEGGKNTAAAIPGAELMIIDGMGHDLPHGGAWPQIIDAVVDHTHKVDT